ncbi:hypothetical protein WJX72_007385 [[Myrmecia] bisecta]|uniref:FAS1 domain-containing protein n=1 Tax=[Myrmecia] bisecta TaxID=41462 RepID=A0AAW1P424_9CHLO
MGPPSRASLRRELVQTERADLCNRTLHSENMAKQTLRLAVLAGILLFASTAFAQEAVVVDPSIANAANDPGPIMDSVDTAAASTTPNSSPAPAAVTPSPPAAKAPQTGPSPLIQFFQSPNATIYSTLYAGIIAGNLQEYLNDSSLAVTIFAPNNQAMASRLGALTKANMITVNDLFSDGKSEVLGEILKYHVSQTVIKVTDFQDKLALNTLANLCSNAKDLTVRIKAGDSTVYLVAAGGTVARIKSSVKVGDSTIYEIDDMLLPATVTVPLTTALGAFQSGQSTSVVDTVVISKQVAAAPKAAPILPPSPSPAATTTIGRSPPATAGRRLL